MAQMRTDAEFLIELERRLRENWPVLRSHLPIWLRRSIPADLPAHYTGLVLNLLWTGPSHPMWGLAMTMVKGIKLDSVRAAAEGVVGAGVVATSTAAKS